MAEDDPDARRLAELEERLKKARGPAEVPRQEAPQSQLGIAFRLVTELLAAVIVGGAIGWALDRVLGTSPFLLIVMFLLGVAAGMRNLVRTAREMNERQNRPSG
jgi:ATP synthase protein I